jgi:kynurenine formamidase
MKMLPVLYAGALLLPICVLTGADSSVTKADVDRMMQTLSNWGRWGKSDELGALNLVTKEKRLQAAALVREGITFSLAHNAITVRADDSPAFEHRMLETGEKPDSGGASDYVGVQYHGFTTTHLDALCHVFYNGKMYNGLSQKEVTSQGAAKLGVDRIRNGIFTRAVLMDIPRHFGKPFLDGNQAIYPQDLEGWEKKAGIKVGAGDAILIRTGRWARRSAQGSWEIMKNSAGLHTSCLPWLKKRDVAVVGSDLATDVMPSGVAGIVLPVHQVLIVAMGVPILDNLDLEAVADAAAARKRWEFLLTVAPLPVQGGTGSPVNPIGSF